MSDSRDLAARTALHLCSGYGGFELALRSVARVRTVAHVERDAYAAAVLVERMGQARLDHAPVWDDLTTFDGRPWHGRVDLITAGFPCQPFSLAGSRRGTDDDRWLWPAIASIIADVGPEFVLLENVPELVRLGLPAVLDDLAKLGFDAEWGLLSAAAVGAPHRRQRLWLVARAISVADTKSARRQGRGLRSGPAEPGDQVLGHACSARRPEVAGGAPAHEGEHAGRPTHTGDQPHRSGEDVGHPSSVGRRWPWDGPATQDRSSRIADTQEPGRFPPCRDDTDGWARWIAEGGPQPVLHRDHDGPPGGLADALHLGGNGLVPQAAAHAIGQLLERGGWVI